MGPYVADWVARQVCLGLLNLSKKHPVDRLYCACLIASTYGLVRVAQVRSILTIYRDQLPGQLPDQLSLMPNGKWLTFYGSPRQIEVP